LRETKKKPRHDTRYKGAAQVFHGNRDHQRQDNPNPPQERGAQLFPSLRYHDANPPLNGRIHTHDMCF